MILPANTSLYLTSLFLSLESLSSLLSFRSLVSWKAPCSKSVKRVDGVDYSV
jgi:hypothetical protein